MTDFVKSIEERYFNDGGHTQHISRLRVQISKCLKLLSVVAWSSLQYSDHFQQCTLLQYSSITTTVLGSFPAVYIVTVQ